MVEGQCSNVGSSEKLSKVEKEMTGLIIQNNVCNGNKDVSVKCESDFSL